MTLKRSFLVPVSAILLSIAVLVSSNDSLGSSLRDLVGINDLEVADFLNQQEEEDQYERVLERRARQFGERCGNRNSCAEGFECTKVNFGNRCLPNKCLEQNANGIADTFDINNLYRSAGISKEDIFAKLAEVRDEHAFLETPEFKALQTAFHANLEPMKAAIDLQKKCVDPYQNNTDAYQTTGTVSYIGLHIEVSRYPAKGLETADNI